MKTRIAFATTGLLALATMIVPAQPPPSQGRRTESFWREVLRVLGITAHPSGLKAPEGSQTGTVWVLDLDRNVRRAMTTEGGYHSPVFEAGDRALLVLKGEDLVRIPLAGGDPVKLHTIAGVLKLVGCRSDGTGAVLFLARGPAGTHPTVGLLSLPSGRVTRLEYDPDSDDKILVNHLTRWDRDFGDDLLIVRRQKKETLLGEKELANVLIKRGPKTPVNLTPDDEVDCVQPSLSSDHRIVAFIRVEED